MSDAGTSQNELALGQAGLGALLEAMEGLLLVVDEEKKILHCSRAAEERLGYGRGELTGAALQTLFLPDGWAEIAGRLEREALRPGRMLSWRVPLMSRELSLIPAETWAVPGSWRGKQIWYVASRELGAGTGEIRALQEANRRLEAALDTLPDLFFEVDPQGVILDYRAPDRGQLYASPRDFLGRTVRQVLPPEVADTIMEAVAQAKEAGRAQGAVYALTTPQGLGWFELSIVARGDMGGPEGRLIALVRDVSERVRTEQSLRESEGRYRAIFEGVRDAIFVESLTGEILDVNSRACEIFGYPREVFLTMTVRDLVPPGDTMLIPADLPSLKVPESPIETVNIRSDGVHIPVEITGQLQTLGEETVLLVVVRDIRERKEAELERLRLLAQIQEQVRRMQQVIGTVPEGVLLLGAGRELLMANDLALDYLEVLAGERGAERLTQLGGVALEALLASTPDAGWETVEREGRIFELASCSLETEGPPAGWVLVVRDVTREREAERWAVQQERLAAVGQLAAGIAHDFNNIMAVIVLYSQMSMRDPHLSPRVRDNLETVVLQARRATDLIQQILDFSRRSVLQRRPVALAELVREQVRLLQRTLPESIRIEISYGLEPTVVEADPTRIQQALMNLALNARDAMPSGGVLSIALGRLELNRAEEAPVPEMEAGSWVMLSVSDTGEGIDPEALPYIFEPFFTTKAAGQGTGLGLAQVYGIVSQHGGHVGVTSEMGMGSCFTIYLPADARLAGSGGREPGASPGAA